MYKDRTTADKRDHGEKRFLETIMTNSPNLYTSTNFQFDYNKISLYR